MATTSAWRWSVGAGPAANTATRPSMGSTGSRRSSQRTTGSCFSSADRRHLFVVDADGDDEVGDEHAVGIEPRADVLGAGRDENAAVGGDGRDRRAAAVEDDELRRRAPLPTGLPRRRSSSQPGRRARRRSGGSRSCGLRSARPSRGGRRRRAVPIGTAPAGCQASARPRSAPARPGRRGPWRRRRRSRSRESTRASWPVSAVFPIRLPVPITASDGRPNGS